MVMKASKFTPEVMISAPRRQPGIPNHDASLILYTTTSYSFKTHDSTTEIRVLHAKSEESLLVERHKKSSDPVWLDGYSHEMALLRGAEDDTTQLIIGDVDNFDKSSYVAGTIDAPCANLKIVKLGRRQFGVAVTAMANPDGTIHNPAKMPKKHTTGMLYRSLFVRHWDAYVQPARQSIWYGCLLPRQDTGAASNEHRTRYFLSALTNALKGGPALESPIPPFGGGDNFDISPRGLIFVAKDPALNPALHTKCNVYLVPLSNYLETTPERFILNMGQYRGAMSSPVLSKDGRRAAFLAMRQDGYEADKNHVFTLADVSYPAWVTNLFDSGNGNGRWERSPASVVFGADAADQLYLTAEYRGNKLLYSTSSTASSDAVPMAITDSRSVADVRPLPNGNVFFSGSSFVDSSFYALGTKHASRHRVTSISSASHHGATHGLSDSQVTQMWFQGAGHNPETSDQVHAWVVRPSDFDAAKKYPLAFMVHGGPQSSWTDAWSTRWNMALFAEQGYVVVCPNPTGSTGFGQGFTDAIASQWGGLPYDDLVRCLDHVERHLAYVDCGNAVALGASFGGYCMNWFQGRPLGRRFKALVNHDGTFSTAYELATDELYFANHDLGGDWMSSREEWQKWDPARHTDRWCTPMLVIHSELDYRLTMAEGLAAFNVLQSRGIESEMLIFKDENHWVQKPENSLVWHSVVLNWINRHVDLPLYRQDVSFGIIQDP